VSFTKGWERKKEKKHRAKLKKDSKRDCMGVRRDQKPKESSKDPEGWERGVRSSTEEEKTTIREEKPTHRTKEHMRGNLIGRGRRGKPEAFLNKGGK